MVESSPALSSNLQNVRSIKRIVYHRTRSFYKVLSADVPAKEGLNAHGVLIDSLHAQRTRDCGTRCGHGDKISDIARTIKCEHRSVSP